MKTSIVILTHNQLELTQQCLDSIRQHTPEPIELIIVDNGSTDGTVEYLKNQSDLHCVYNETNLGFAKGCNQGTEIATGEYVLYLNNDTIVTENWLGNMLKLFDRDPQIGMVGPVSNYVSGYQKVEVSYTTLADMPAFAQDYCATNKDRFRYVLRLVGFCLLVKRAVLEEIGLFDERFGLGGAEDDDLCMRALANGTRLAIAQDSFIHHIGHSTFVTAQIDRAQLQQENINKLIEKWGFNPFYYMHPRYELINLVPTSATRILDIGCACGAIGIELLNRQSCQLYGVELSAQPAQIARAYYEEVVEGDLERTELPYPDEHFDAILCGDVLEHLQNPWEVVRKLARVLKPGGAIIVSLPNILNQEVLFPYLQGNWNYVDAGILDRTHLRFFTRTTKDSLFPSDLFEIDANLVNLSSLTSHQQIFLLELMHLGRKYGYNMDRLVEDAAIYQFIMRVIKK